MWGTDFNLIAQMMPGRTRRQVRSKFKLEERKNPAKIHLAILRKLPVKMDAYQDLTRHTPESIEQEIRDLRARHEELMKMEEAAREEAIRQDAERAAKADAEKYGFKDVHKEEEEE
jgi:transcription factor TFIIIB component B''